MIHCPFVTRPLLLQARRERERGLHRHAVGVRHVHGIARRFPYQYCHVFIRIIKVEAPEFVPVLPHVYPLFHIVVAGTCVSRASRRSTCTWPPRATLASRAALSSTWAACASFFFFFLLFKSQQQESQSKFSSGNWLYSARGQAELHHTLRSAAVCGAVQRVHAARYGTNCRD